MEHDGAFVGLTEKSIRHKDVAALRWGLQQRKRKENKKMTWKKRMVCASLKDTRNCFHGRERVGLAKIVPTTKR